MVDGQEKTTQVQILDGDIAEKGEDGYSPTVTAVKENGITTITITSKINDEIVTNTVQILDGQDGAQGPAGQDGNDGEDGVSPIINVEPIVGGNRITITDIEGIHSFNILNGQDGQNGQDGKDGIDGQDGNDGEDGYSPTVTSTSIENGTRIIITDKNGDHIFDILNGEDGQDGIRGQDGEDGKSIVAGNVTAESGDSDTQPIINITLNSQLSDETKNVYDFSFTIPKGQNGQDGQQGPAGQDGNDGEDGYSPTVTITSITNGNRVTITDTNGDHTFDVMNGENGQDGEQGLQGPAGKDGNDGEDGQDGFSPTATVNKVNKTTTVTITDKNGTTTATILDGESGKYEVVTELPSVSDAELNTIYLLLIPEYQRGLNIGLTNSASANKNFYEEWIIVEDEDTGDRTWELFAPQQYRISQAMIDYIWGVRENFTVYDDWTNPDIIPDYQKEFGEVTPLRNFIYRTNGTDLILVKYIGDGDVYLNIAPYYEVNGIIYTSVKIDGSYDPSMIFYKVDNDGNQTVYTDFATDYPPNIDENGVDISQTLLTGPSVYSLYIADTITSIKRVLIGTSNIPIYHIPASITEIGDYAFYNSSNQTMVFERLSQDGKTATRVGFESSNIEKIGEYACAKTPNMRWLDDQGNPSITIKTPSTLKKISNYAFYNAGQLAHIDTTNSTNLFIGKGAFERSNLSAVQKLSPTTYYTDSAFLGYTTLYHDSNREVGRGNIFFYDSNTIGYNYNDVAHTEASETDKLSVTLTSIDPTFES